MKVSKEFAGTFLKAADVPEPLAVTVTSCTKQQMPGDPPEYRWVLHFQEIESGLVLNKTNAAMCADLYGDDSDDWIGRPILIVQEMTDYGGKRVECLRIHKPRPDQVEAARPQAANKPLYQKMIERLNACTTIEQVAMTAEKINEHRDKLDPSAQEVVDRAVIEAQKRVNQPADEEF